MTQGSPGTLQLLYKKEAGKGHGEESALGRPHRVLLSYSCVVLAFADRSETTLGIDCKRCLLGSHCEGAYSQIGLVGRHYGFYYSSSMAQSLRGNSCKNVVCVTSSIALPSLGENIAQSSRSTRVQLEHSPITVLLSSFLFSLSFSLSRFNFPTTVSLKSLLWSYTSFLSPNLSLSSVTSIFILFSASSSLSVFPLALQSFSLYHLSLHLCHSTFYYLA